MIMDPGLSKNTSIDKPDTPPGGYRYMAAVKSKTVRDYENLIGDLRKENLQLRLRLFYINGHHECPPTNFEGDESEVGDLHRQVSAEFTKHAQEIRQRDELLALERSKSADQQVAVDKLYSEKLDYEREIRNIQGKCSADGPLYHVRMDCTVSFLEKCNKRLEDTVKDLKQRVHVLEKTEVADLERELRAKAAELQALNKSNIILNEKINSLRTEKSTWTAVTNMTRSFLQLLDSSLSSGNVQAAMQAKEDFQSKLDKVAQPKTHSHGDLQQWNASLQDQVWKADLELKSKEMTIEGLNNEIAQLTSSLEASHTRCLDLEGEIRKASKLHERICIEKDKLLETSKRKLQNLEKQIQETSTLKSRQSSLESECNSLHITVREKSSFIEELLSERGKSVAETEKSLQELLLVLKQKDETIATLREKLRSGDGEQEPSVALARCEESAAQQRSLMDRSESRENLPSARFSPEGSDVLSVSVQSVTHGVPAEVAGLCHVVRELAQEAQLLPPTPQPGEDSSHGVQELTTILRKARGSGLQFSMPAESSSANGGIGDHFGEELRDPSVPQAIELLGLGGKLQQLYGALYQAEGPATSEWQKEDVVGLLDAVLEKTLQEANAATEPCGDPKDSMRDRCSLLQERVEAAHSALLSLNTSADGSGADLCRDDMLRDLSSALECVVELRNEVEALSLTMSPSRHRKHMASMDELVFAVNSSGQLVPVSIDSMEQNAVCDASVQTEEPDDDPESLKTELSKARAQVKFLQRSLKDSFSVKITESPTGPNAQPLIEIDQNLPLLSPLAGQSPRKSGLSANRRWRKQLTNQKMSEFGLSENVFELQEEIFFLVLRIEDLERQLKEHPEQVLPTARRASGVPSGRPSGSPAEDACELERKNIALEQQLHQMQEVSSELLCRLEELARFLEQLLTYDGTGSLGSVTLSPEMVAKIRQLVADSKDLSVSVSQSILGSDNNSILSEHASKRSSVDRSLLSCSILSKGKKDEINVASKSSGRPELLIPPTLDDYIFMEDELKMLRERVREQTSEISNLTRRLEEERLNSPATGGGRCPSRRHPGTPASLVEGEDTDASWRYQDQVVLVQASDSDDILLLLNERGLPENVYLRSSWQKQALNGPSLEPAPPAVSSAAAVEEADADASSSSSPSLLRWKEAAARNSAMETGAPQEPLVPIGRFQCWSSDSDIWSEPDRSVSEQRMGGVCRKEWSKQPRRSPKEARKVMAGGRQEPSSDAGAKKTKDVWPTWPEPAKGKRPSGPADGGRSKRTSSASHTDTQKLEKVLRRVQHCNARLEDTLGVHKELCQKLLTSIPPEGLKDAPEPQLASLVETHAQALKKLEFRLMEMSIKNEVLQEILTERIAESGLEQCQKELECKERREEILKRAMVHKQKAKLQLEKELEECQKELQSLQEAHSVLEEDYKAAMRSSEPVPKSRQPSLEKSSAEPRDESVAQEVARLSKEVSGLSEEKGTLLQRLEALQREHEVLLESSSNKISELVTKLGPLSTQNKNQQEEIRSLMEVGDCLSREKLRLQHDLDAAFAKLDGLQVENQDLRDSVLSLRKQEGLLRESIEKAMDELQATKKISHEYKESERLVRLEKEQLSSRLEALECEKQSLYEEKQRLILEVSAGEDAVERVSNKLVSCEAECSKLRAQRSSLETELQASSDKLEESDRVAKGLKEELNATKLKLENMNSRCSLLEQELDSSKEEQRVLVRKNSELQRTLEAVGREAQQSKTFARMSLDKRQMMAVMELEDQNKNLQGTVVDLKLKLEKVSYENKSLRSELRVKEQIQAENSPASARTAESSAQFFTANSGCATAWQTPLQPGRHSGPRSQHTSPDLGIDSDPTTDRDGGAGVGSMEGFEEHWQHRMGPNWSISSVQSAPDAIGGSCPRCQQGSSAALVKHRANATYAGEQPDWPSSAQSPLKSGFPVISCTLSSPGVRMCAIVQPTDHEELKAQVDKSIYLIRKVESSVRNAIDALADFASDCTEPPQCNSLLQDVERGCQSIKACLTEIFKLICSFTIAQSPELRDDQGFEYKQLKLELNKLQEKHSQQSAELQLALEQISSFKEKKEGMERAISRQLNKTKMVLKQTKGNLIMRARDAKPDKK
ncbi:uncharacterized protein LOC144150613 isoform X4 [Haemaphysalis longicornis]